MLFSCVAGDELFSPQLRSGSGHFYAADPLLTPGTVKSGQYTPSCPRNYVYLTNQSQGGYTGYPARPGPYQDSPPANSMCLSPPYQTAMPLDGSAHMYPLDRQQAVPMVEYFNDIFNLVMDRYCLAMVIHTLTHKEHARGNPRFI